MHAALQEMLLATFLLFKLSMFGAKPIVVSFLVIAFVCRRSIERMY